MNDLWQHQQEDVDTHWQDVAHARFWEPRLGKTRATVEEMVRLSVSNGFMNAQVSRFLIVCPKAVAPVWIEELDEGSQFWVRDYTTGPLTDRFTDPTAQVCLVNYESLDKLKTKIAAWSPQYICFDESHKIKNFSAGRSKAAHALADQARYRRLLTGTPDPKNFADYFSQYRALDPNVFGKKITPFRNRYCVLDQYWQVSGYRNLDELKDKVFSLADRRYRKDCLDLPAVQEIVRHVMLPDEIESLYKRIVREGLVEHNGEQVGTEFRLARVGLLQQLTGGFLNGQHVHDAKMEALQEELRDATEPVVVFCRYRAEIDVLHTTFNAPYIDGRVSDEKREARRQDFQAGNVPMLLVQIDTGSSGIDLSRAGLGVFYSTTFNAADFQQAKDRIWKQRGQIGYVYLVCPGTVDVTLLANNKRKRDASASFWSEKELMGE